MKMKLRHHHGNKNRPYLQDMTTKELKTHTNLDQTHNRRISENRQNIYIITHTRSLTTEETKKWDSLKA